MTNRIIVAEIETPAPIVYVKANGSTINAFGLEEARQIFHALGEALQEEHRAGEVR